MTRTSGQSYNSLVVGARLCLVGAFPLLTRLLLLLSLVAVLAGTPMRQVEAAHDLARTVAEMDDGRGVEEQDGGVGDDAPVALNGSVDPDATGEHSLGDILDLLHLPGNFEPSAGSITWAKGSRTPQPPRDDRRRAWLQRFRI